MLRRINILLLCLLPLAAFASHAKMPPAVEGNPRLYPYPADSANNTGVAVIVCPGGSYSWLDMKTEGDGVAKWLQQEGINAFVLRYRVANISAYVLGYRVIGLGNKYPDMVSDVEAALEYVYTHAKDYGIDTAKIGVMGFSAGGHLTMSSYIYNQTSYKPHFLCPVYPVVTLSDRKLTHKRSRRGALGVWRQFNHQMRDSLSLEKNIPSSCPPVFLINCQDDPTVRYRNSELLDSALTAQQVPHVYLQYKTGGHGFGANPAKTSAEAINWKNEFLLWLKKILNYD